MRILNKRLYVKAWLTQGSIWAAAVFTVVFWIAWAVTWSINSVPADSAIRNTILVWTLTLTLSFHLLCFYMYRHSFAKLHGDVFTSNWVATCVLVRATATMEALAGAVGIDALAEGVAKRHDRVNEAHARLKQQERLPADVDAALSLALRESLSVYLAEMPGSYRNKTSNMRAAEKLPTHAQQFIASYFPDLVALNLTLFDETVVDTQEKGLYQAVQNLVAMNCSPADIRAHIDAWLSHGESQARAAVVLPINIAI